MEQSPLGDPVWPTCVQALDQTGFCKPSLPVGGSAPPYWGVLLGEDLSRSNSAPCEGWLLGAVPLVCPRPSSPNRKATGLLLQPLEGALCPQQDRPPPCLQGPCLAPLQTRAQTVGQGNLCPSVRSVHCIAWPGPGPRDVCQNPSPRRGVTVFSRSMQPRSGRWAQLPRERRLWAPRAGRACVLRSLSSDDRFQWEVACTCAACRVKCTRQQFSVSLLDEPPPALNRGHSPLSAPPPSPGQPLPVARERLSRTVV